MIEQMVETRTWKAARGLIEDGRCRICFSHGETVKHLVAGCRVLANSEYLIRHNRALMILAVAWAKENELIGEDTVWYKVSTVLENGKAKLVWAFQFNLRKTNTSRRPDFILEDKESKKIWIFYMACPQQQKHRSKTVGKADEVYTISIRVERKEAWIQDNGDTTDNWSVRRWNEKRNGRVVECFKQKRAGQNRWPEKCRKRH